MHRPGVHLYCPPVGSHTVGHDIRRTASARCASDFLRSISTSRIPWRDGRCVLGVAGGPVALDRRPAGGFRSCSGGLDPTSESADLQLADPSRMVELICAHGYSSSLAAATLLDLGFAGATDVIGGFEAWAAAGLRVELA
jgi:hypothetical protein